MPRKGVEGVGVDGQRCPGPFLLPTWYGRGVGTYFGVEQRGHPGAEGPRVLQVLQHCVVHL